MAFSSTSVPEQASKMQSFSAKTVSHAELWTTIDSDQHDVTLNSPSGWAVSGASAQASGRITNYKRNERKNASNGWLLGGEGEPMRWTPFLKFHLSVSKEITFSWLSFFLQKFENKKKLRLKKKMNLTLRVTEGRSGEILLPINPFDCQSKK